MATVEMALPAGKTAATRQMVTLRIWRGDANGGKFEDYVTPVTEGMIVRTQTDEIIKARKMVLELLLLKHPVDCPVCDAAGDCRRSCA